MINIDTNKLSLYLEGRLNISKPFDKLALIEIIKYDCRVNTEDLFKLIDSSSFYSMAINLVIRHSNNIEKLLEKVGYDNLTFFK